MNKLLLIHGANLNFLGRRQPEHYGFLTLDELEELTRQEARKYNFGIIAYQSNHEGNLIDKLQSEAKCCSGIIINPGAFAHSSYALHDALLDTGRPVIEVHLSNIQKRETWRRRSLTQFACINVIVGKKEAGYKEAVKLLVEYIRNVR